MSALNNIIDEEDQIKLDEIKERICSEMNIKTSLGRAAMLATLVNIKVLDNKQLDYGPRNLQKFGPYGVAVRTSDKLERLINLLENQRKGQTIKNETLADTWLDLANYGLIGFCMEDKLWS